MTIPRGTDDQAVCSKDMTTYGVFESKKQAPKEKVSEARVGLTKTKEDRLRFKENCNSKVSAQIAYYTSGDGNFDRVKFVQDAKSKKVHGARNGVPGTFLMRTLMSLFSLKGRNGSAAMMFTKCFPGEVPWIITKAEQDEVQWKERAKTRRGRNRRIDSKRTSVEVEKSKKKRKEKSVAQEKEEKKVSKEATVAKIKRGKRKRKTKTTSPVKTRKKKKERRVVTKELAKKKTKRADDGRRKIVEGKETTSRVGKDAKIRKTTTTTSKRPPLLLPPKKMKATSPTSDSGSFTAAMNLLVAATQHRTATMTVWGTSRSNSPSSSDESQNESPNDGSAPMVGSLGLLSTTCVERHELLRDGTKCSAMTIVVPPGRPACRGGWVGRDLNMSTPDMSDHRLPSPHFEMKPSAARVKQLSPPSSSTFLPHSLSLLKRHRNIPLDILTDVIDKSRKGVNIASTASSLPGATTRQNLPGK